MTINKLLELLTPHTQKRNVALGEFSESEYIPYKCYWDENTILTKNNELMRVIRLSGFPFETVDDRDLEQRKQARNSLFKNLSSGNLSIYTHIIRRRKPLSFGNKSDYVADPTVMMVKDFSSYLQEEWRKKYVTFESFFNELYITVLYKVDTQGGAAAITNMLSSISAAGNAKESWEQTMHEISDALHEVSNRITSAMKEYEPELLGMQANDDGTATCQILEFLSMIVNCGVHSKVLVPKTGNIDKVIPTRRLFFGNKCIETVAPGESIYSSLISIKEYGPTTHACCMDRFLSLPYEMIITQSFTFFNRTVAIGQMQTQQKRLFNSGDNATSQILEISNALDMATSGDVAFGNHHLSIMCSARDVKELEDTISQVAVELSNTGAIVAREDINLEAAFWGQLPGNMQCVIRRSMIHTGNLADFSAMHNHPLGKIFGNHWGEFVTILETTSGSPYFFNFHMRDIGHTLIIGPTGAGKTVLMNFLCAQAQKFKPRMYFFDKDRGAEIFIRALGGVYTFLDPAKKSNFNPLQLQDSGENRTFLLEWLRILVTTNGETLSADDIKTLTIAINGNYKLARKDRRLRNIVPFLGMDGPGTLAGRISMWHSKGSHANVFDNEEDNIDLSKDRTFGFEMAELLKDPISLSPVLLYVFHRINLSLDGYPTMIVLDEAWALIDNPIFAPKIKDWLKVLRKLNAFVIFATQSVEDAAKSRISDTLIQQTATQIFLPNLKATDVYRSAFMLSQREYEIIKTTDPSSRYFLVKQGISSVVSRVNLSGLDNIINVLSGRTETVLLVDRLRAEFGDNPLNWLGKFYVEAKKK